MLMPPPGAGKQRDGDDKKQEPADSLARLEHQDEQNDPDHRSYPGRQIFNIKLAGKIFDFVHFYIFCRFRLTLSWSAEHRSARIVDISGGAMLRASAFADVSLIVERIRLS
jgi:hypothetical protein